MVDLLEMARTVRNVEYRREEAVQELESKIMESEEAIRQCVLEACERLLSDDKTSAERSGLFRITGPSGEVCYVLEYSYGVGAHTRALAGVASRLGYRADTANPLLALKELLAGNGAGRVPEDMRHSVEACLAAAWDMFAGHDFEAMCGQKLLGRMEKIRWEPPWLHFVIERHGAMVGRGSPRAELQYWSVNLDSLKAGIERVGRRQVYPPRSRKKAN